MNPVRYAALAAALSVLAWTGPAAAADTTTAEPAEQRLTFDVFLNGRAIGKHHFDINRDGGLWTVASDASYDVRILFFNAYRYRHRAEEQWQDGCLTSIRSSTDDDGETTELRGHRTDTVLRLTVNGDTTDLDKDCVASFAYWHPAWLEQSQLLNPQTGRLEAVALIGGEPAALPWQDSLSARRYELITPESPIELWYDESGRWVGLRSQLESGHTVTYRVADGDQAVNRSDSAPDTDNPS